MTTYKVSNSAFDVLEELGKKGETTPDTIRDIANNCIIGSDNDPRDQELAAELRRLASWWDKNRGDFSFKT